MSRNGSGTFTLVAGNPVVTGTTISSTWANNTLSDIANALTASVANDGQTPITANMDFDGFNLSSIGTLTATTLSATSVTYSGNITSTGSAARFLADFSTSTLTNRLIFQSSTLNGNTGIFATPNGTSNSSNWAATNNSTVTNTAFIQMQCNLNDARLVSGTTGTGTAVPLGIYVDTSTLAASIDTSGNWTIPKTATFSDDITANGRVFSPIAVAAAYKNLAASATGTAATVTVTADQVALEGTNIATVVRTVSLTIDLSAAGANGLDTGTSAASTWYSLWVIYNPTTSTIAGLASLSATAPTMPADYTYKARIGWCRTDGTANKYPLSFAQRGNRVQYKVAAGSNLTALPLPASGAAGNPAVPTWIAVATGNYVPSTAGSILISAIGGTKASLTIIVAPNNAYGSNASFTNPPPIMTSSSGTGNASNVHGELILETTNIYWANNDASSALACLGWVDNI
jgi:hypothetical protein